MSVKAVIGVLCIASYAIARTDVPIIGILSQETYSVENLFPNEQYQSFIAASYVKLLESAGARVIPIRIGQGEDYYKEIINNTNGVLFPGGATWFNQSDGYADAGQILYDLALEANQAGDYYPIWGICLGMELLAQVAVGGRELRADCLSKKISLPLEFRKGYRKSKTFASAPTKILRTLREENVTYNYHRYCVTEQNFTRFGLDADWEIIATNKDVYGLEFISVFESRLYPFYGIQFHPEKNQYEFKASLQIPHSMEAVEVSQYFANFFVEETRKSGHSFGEWKAEQEALIFNYPTHFTGIKNSSYEQLYMFGKKSVEGSDN